MKVLLITPWNNSWIPLYSKVFEERGHALLVDKAPRLKADCYLHMWAGMTEPVEGAANLMFMRRYEFFDFDWKRYDWSKIDRLIFCNSFFKNQVDAFFASSNGPTCPTELVYNAVDFDKWTFKERKPGYKIGMACHVHPKKNLPLAAQILMELGPDYELHIAGEIQDPCTALYLKSLGLKIRCYGHVKDMDQWWEDKNYCLSTSISEGNPNNVLESMAKGIRPVIHKWPGSKDQFNGRWLFRTVGEAVSQIKDNRYHSDIYFNHAEMMFGLNNYRVVVSMAEEI